MKAIKLNSSSLKTIKIKQFTYTYLHLYTLKEKIIIYRILLLTIFMFNKKVDI